MEKTNIGRLSVKVANNEFDQTHLMIDFKMCCFYVVLDLSGSVDCRDTVRVKW